MKPQILFITVLILIGSLAVAQTRAITNITGDLYRFQNNNHYSVFLVTEEGIVVTDPINQEAATWLNEELKKRFNVPVKYLIYSHDHADHISGGAAFGDDITVIGHEQTKAKIISEKREAPLPDITFQDQYTLELGGKKVELYFPGKSHGDNCIAMLFPEEKTVFVVDFITVKRLPYQNLSSSYMPDWVESIKMVESLDFEILAPGHGSLGTKADATEHRQYFEALQQAVAQEMAAGKSLEEMQQSIKLDQYKDFGQYEEWLPLNIEGMYKMLKK